jgi:2-methylisocitrate lyase-like PEP mutase family enzyme
VGINVEDGISRSASLYGVDEQAAKVAAVRAAADERGLAFVVNARVDVFWRRVGDESGRLEETVRRARAYRAAGADCIFVPGLVEEAAIAAFLRESPGPLNVLAGPATPPVERLRALGVARLSVGSGISRAALGFVRRAGRELYEQGTYAALSEDTIPFDEVTQLLTARRR